MCRKSKKAGPEVKDRRTCTIAELEEALVNIGADTLPAETTRLLDQLENISGEQRKGAVPTAAERRRKIRRPERRQHLVGSAIRVLTYVVMILSALSLAAMAAFPNLFSIKVDGDSYAIVPSGQTELNNEPSAQYQSLSQALEVNGFPALAPTWIPERPGVVWVHMDRHSETVTCSAWYDAGNPEEGLFIRVVQYAEGGQATEKFESNKGGGTPWEHDGTSYYLSENEDRRCRGTWTYGNYLCEVVGSITEEELKQVLDSVQVK